MWIKVACIFFKVYTDTSKDVLINQEITYYKMRYKIDKNSYIFELGDEENFQYSYLTSVSNIISENNDYHYYLLHGNAKTSTLLDNRARNKRF